MVTIDEMDDAAMSALDSQETRTRSVSFVGFDAEFRADYKPKRIPLLGSESVSVKLIVQGESAGRARITDSQSKKQRTRSYLRLVMAAAQGLHERHKSPFMKLAEEITKGDF